MTTKIDQEEERIYSTHEYIGDVTPEQADECASLRVAFKGLETKLWNLGPEDRSASDRFRRIALTKIEEASMYAIKAVVFRGKKVR